MKRRYYSHRQAYEPSSLRQALGSVAICMGVWALLGSGMIFRATWVTAVATWVVGFVLASAWMGWRWRQWRERHPIVTPEEVWRRRREAAPWN